MSRDGSASLIPAGRPLELPGRGVTWIRERLGPSPDAPVVMLLHGLGATGALNWASVFGPLSAGFRVVAPDHRGHGRGIRARRFRLADCADDVVAIADELDIDRFIAVGYSMGGPIAQLVAHRHPARVEGMVLCATSRDFRGRPTESLRFNALRLVAAAAALLPGDRGALTSAGAVWPGGESPFDEMRRTDRRAVLQAADALGRFTSRDWIGDLDIPVSVVLTTRDRLVPLRRQAKLLAAVPGAVGHPLDGGHLDCAAAPARFASVVVEACEVVAARAGHPIDWLAGPIAAA